MPDLRRISLVIACTKSDSDFQNPEYMGSLQESFRAKIAKIAARRQKSLLDDKLACVELILEDLPTHSRYRVTFRIPIYDRQVSDV